jgi:hypothetical protein
LMLCAAAPPAQSPAPKIAPASVKNWRVDIRSSFEVFHSFARPIES